MVLFEALGAARAHVTVDDGGVRCATAHGGFYAPFAELADVTVEVGAFHLAVLHLDGKDGARTTLRVAAHEALEVQGEILHGLGAFPRREGQDLGALAMLARAGRPLLAWRAEAAAWGRSASGYRGAALDPDAVAACLLDAAAPADVRAACAHAMLAAAAERELSAVARAFAVRALPPLVVVAARLGRAGAALVPDAMCDDALAVLDAADVAEARRAMLEPSTHEDEAHVHALMERARAAALAHADAATPHRRRFRAHALGGYAGEQGVTRFK